MKCNANESLPLFGFSYGIDSGDSNVGGGMHEDRFEKKESDHLRLRKMERENGNYRRVECKSRIRFRIDLLLEI